MTPEEIRHHLAGQLAPRETLVFLTDSFIPEIVRRLNEPGTRRRMALYGGDRIPENERNLTDVRNRMSLLIEYKLAWVGNDVLEDYGIHDLFWTNVVANRFPDLEVRDDRGTRGIRVEVKCLEAVAEEKAANFDTLKKDLNPTTDYIVVFVWEWVRDQAAVRWDRAPKILKAFVFHASSLAELRDFNWLSKPPRNPGDGYQGFDLRYAVNCTAGVYNEEEGNYGKLMRLWSEDAVYAPGLTSLLEQTIQDYQAFEDFTIWSGFEVLSHDILERFTGGTAVSTLAFQGGVVGYASGTLGFVSARRATRSQDQLAIGHAAALRRLIVMTDKYRWNDFQVNGKALLKLGSGKKPKHLLAHLSRN